MQSIASWTIIDAFGSDVKFILLALERLLLTRVKSSLVNDSEIPELAAATSLLINLIGLPEMLS
jgi:hypothetical protein